MCDFNCSSEDAHGTVQIGQHNSSKLILRLFDFAGCLLVFSFKGAAGFLTGIFDTDARVARFACCNF